MRVCFHSNSFLSINKTILLERIYKAAQHRTKNQSSASPTTLFCYCMAFVYICNKCYVRFIEYVLYVILCSHFPSIKLKLSHCWHGRSVQMVRKTKGSVHPSIVSFQVMPVLFSPRGSSTVSCRM